VFTVILIHLFEQDQLFEGKLLYWYYRRDFDFNLPIRAILLLVSIQVLLLVNVTYLHCLHQTVISVTCLTGCCQPLQL